MRKVLVKDSIYRLYICIYIHNLELCLRTFAIFFSFSAKTYASFAIKYTVSEYIKRFL